MHADPVYEFEVRFTFKSRPDVGFSFDRAIQLGVTTLETREGKVHGTMTLRLESGDPNAARGKALEVAEKIASLLSLALDAGFAVEEVRVTRKPEIKEEGGVKKITVFDYAIGREWANITAIYSKEEINELEIKLQNLMNRIERGAHGRDILRAIKWWRKGSLEEDKVDAFLHYYVALEMLASIKGYKGKYGDWVKRFTEDYSITYEPDGRTPINEIRGKIVHAAGPEKEAAEMLAVQYADMLGRELFDAIKKLVMELP
ncbi:MAG: hypothetical protein LM590_15135 [Thermofilum sp.]|nr:hypothetical protein [Thermofilum sp.]